MVERYYYSSPDSDEHSKWFQFYGNFLLIIIIDAKAIHGKFTAFDRCIELNYATTLDMNQTEDQIAQISSKVNRNGSGSICLCLRQRPDFRP